MTTQLHLAGSSAGMKRSLRARLPIRVVLADDHAVARRGLRRLLDADEDVEVIAEASDLATAMRHVHRERPDVLALNLRLTNGSTIEAIRGLRAQVAETEVVALTMEDSPLFARKAIGAGAVGFVLKDRADSELLTAIHSAARGEEYVSLRVAGGLEALRRGSGGSAPGSRRARYDAT